MTLPPWVEGVRARLGVDSDRRIARDVGLSHARVSAVRKRLGITAFSAAMTPQRARVLAVLREEPRTLAQVAEDALGGDGPEERGRTRQALLWLVKHGHAERARRGEYRRAAQRRGGSVENLAPGY